MQTPTEAIIVEDRAPALAHYPHARRVGNLVFVSGISCRRPDNSWEGVTRREDGSVELDMRVQTRAVIENIRHILRAAGLDLSNVVDVTTYLVNMRDYAAYNEVYNEYFEAQTGPSRTTVAVAQLPNPNLLIEIKAVAAV
jgi:2-aminomuconate deaminase